MFVGELPWGFSSSSFFHLPYVPSPSLGASTLSFLWMVEISKKVKFFAWQVIYGKFNTWIVFESSFPFCWFCNGALFVIEWWRTGSYLVDCQFAITIWERCWASFVICWVRNRSCGSLIEETLLNPPFWDKGRVLWQACIFVVIGGYGLRK